MNYTVPGSNSLHADHLCEAAHVVVKTAPRVPLGLGGEATLGVMDASGGIHLGTALLVLARVILTSGLARAHCIYQDQRFSLLSRKNELVESEMSGV